MYQDPVLCGMFGVEASNEFSGTISSNLLVLAVSICAVLKDLKRLIRSKTFLLNHHRQLLRSTHIHDGTSLECLDYSSKVSIKSARKFQNALRRV